MDTATILVADDDRGSVLLMRKILEADEYTVLEASNGEAALDILRENSHVDFVVLDVLMPKIDGVEVCRRIKADPKTASVPVILVSAVRTDDSSIREGLVAGADGYLPKPVESISLRAWVKAGLRIRALQSKLAERHAGPTHSANEVLQVFARLSHAVNNPLQALYATVDILTLSVPDDSEAAALAADIVSHAEEVADVVAEASVKASRLLERE